jgi:hypothetical protein
MKHIFLFMILLLLIPGQASTQSIKHVVLIGMDGVSAEGFQYSNTPVLNEIIRNGCISLKTRAVMPTVSAPNWASILSGAGPEQHGVTSNEWSLNNQPFEPTIKDNQGYFTSVFTLLNKQKPTAVTGMFYDWDWIGTYINPVYPTTNKFIQGYTNVTTATCEFLKSKKPAFTFVYYGHPDEVGHQSGHGTPEYYQSIADIDTEIGKIITVLKETGMYSSTCIMVVSDHGGIGKGHGGESRIEMEVPWIISGPGIAKNRLLLMPNDQANTAVTIAKLLGLKAPAEWIGRVNKEAFIQPSDSKNRFPSFVRKPMISLKEGIYSGPQQIEISSLTPGAEIFYTLDGSVPSASSAKYKFPLQISGNTVLSAIAIATGQCSETVIQRYSFIRNIKSAVINPLPSSKYPGLGVNSLFDGLVGSSNYKGRQWMGWEGEDVEIEVDLGENRKIQTIGIDVLQLPASWIFLPASIEFYTSGDGQIFDHAGTYNPADVDDMRKDGPVLLARAFEDLKARYLRIRISNVGICPEGHPGAGQKAWVFVSEVEIE